MPDLTERIEAATITEKGPVYAKVTGAFLKKNAVSLNNRLYPAETVERVVAKAQQEIAAKGELPIQQLDRHATADADESLNIVGKVTKVWLDGELARYEAEIPNTTAGRDMANLVQGGFLNTVSLRARPGSAVVDRGTIGEREVDVIRDFDLAGIDYTLTPGIQDVARVESIQIFESVDPAKVQSTLTEIADESAVYARAWYETFLDAAEKGQLDRVTIDIVQNEWLPLSEVKRSAAQRKKIDAEDFAGPHRSFPVVTQQDVFDCARLIGHAANPAGVKRRIIAIAKRKGFKLPTSWEAKTKESAPVPDQNTNATPALSEAGSHSHAHRHEMPNHYGSSDSYTHEHSHSHTGAEMEHHDSAEAHRHGHAEESAVRVATHTHTPAERAAIAIQNLATTLRECQLTPAEFTQVQKAAAGADKQTDRLLALLGVPDKDENAKESSPKRGALTEQGAAISQANRSRLAAAHDHIATALGMECAPEEEDDADGESLKLNRRSLKAMISEAITNASRNGAEQRAPAATESGAGQASGASERIAVLVEAMTALATNQKAMSEAIASLRENLPKEAAKAAADAAWRPERRTQVVENADASRPGGGDERAVVQGRLADRTVPVEQRLKMATDLISKNAGVYNFLAVTGAFEDSGALGGSN